MMKNVLKFVFIYFSIISIVAGCAKRNCDDFVGAETSKQKDIESSFSIAIPNKWSVKRRKDGESSQLIIKAAGSCKITILVASRNLDHHEKSMDPISLIDAMLNSSVDNLNSKGQNVLGYGKYQSFKGTFPSFAITSVDADGKRTFASYGALSEDRNLSIIVSTRNEQHSEKLAGLLKSLVDSVELY